MLQLKNMNKRKAFISIIIPSYQSSNYISHCIKALKAQTYPKKKYEVIIVDNNSNDGTVKIIRQYEEIKLLNEERQGAYFARNLGIEASKSPIIAFTDSDCAPFADWLEKINIAMSDPNVCIVLGDRRYAKKTKSLSLLADFESEKSNYIASNDAADVYYGYTNNMAVRKALFDEVGLFPTVSRGGDSLFVGRVVDRISTDVVVYDPNICVTHLEIKNLWGYYKKRIIRGFSNQKMSSYRKYRTLNNKERLLIFNVLRKNKQLSRASSVRLFGLLVLGAALYGVGHFYANLRDPL